MAIFKKKTMGKKLGKELKLWTTLAFTERQILGRGLKTAYKIGRFAVRRPILTALAYYKLGKGYRGHKKYLKRKAAGSRYDGKMILRKGEIQF